MNHCILCVVFTWGLISRIWILKSSAVEMSLGHWIKWSPWSTCTNTEYCLEGTRERYRECEMGKRCVGIEAESEGCPDTLCKDRPVFPGDIAYAEMHSFIAVECETSVKYLTRGRYSSLMKHNLTRMFPRIKSVIENSFYNVKVTKKTLSFEKNIFKYCFEPQLKTMTLDYLKDLVGTGSLRFKYTSFQCALPKPSEQKHVTGFALGIEENDQPYGIYFQVETANGFKTVHYKHMAGSYTNAYNLIWS